MSSDENQNKPGMCEYVLQRSTITTMSTSLYSFPYNNYLLNAN